VLCHRAAKQGCLPTLEGRQAERFRCCFVGPCKKAFYRADSHKSYADALRNHLLMHEERELAACGFNRDLLEEDRHRALGMEEETPDSQPTGVQLDREILHLVEGWIKPAHLESLHHLLKD
jgi:hypothetical protein